MSTMTPEAIAKMVGATANFIGQARYAAAVAEDPDAPTWDDLVEGSEEDREIANGYARAAGPDAAAAMQMFHHVLTESNDTWAKVLRDQVDRAVEHTISRLEREWINPLIGRLAQEGVTLEQFLAERQPVVAGEVLATAPDTGTGAEAGGVES